MSHLVLAPSEIRVAGHQKSIAGTDTEIAAGADPMVVDDAKYHLPVATSHLTRAQAAVTDLGRTPVDVPAGTGGRGATTSALTEGLEIGLLASAASWWWVRPRRSPVAVVTSRTDVTTRRHAGPSGKPQDSTERSRADRAQTVSASVVVTDPSSVRLDAFSVTAPVVPVRTVAGRLDPPQDPQQVGVVYISALPGGTTGTTMLVGHMDGPSGPGALHRLVRARRGETITVADDNGRAVEFVVESRSV